MSESASLCACSSPLVQTTRSCAHCGRDLNGSERHALGPQAQGMARLVAELVVEMLRSEVSRQKPGRPAAAVREQLELGDTE